MDNNSIIDIIESSIKVKQDLISNGKIISTILEVTQEIISAFNNDKKVLLCGNGGSAADAQHLAAEFSGRFYFDRSPLFSEALHVNTSYLTAVANDYSYNEVYARILKAMGRKGDILISLSTSGNSENIIRAIAVAEDIGMITVGFTGKTGGKMKNICKYILNVPSIDTPRIQESHITIGHIICELVEEALFKRK